MVVSAAFMKLTSNYSDQIAEVFLERSKDMIFVISKTFSGSELTKIFKGEANIMNDYEEPPIDDWQTESDLTPKEQKALENYLQELEAK